MWWNFKKPKSTFNNTHFQVIPGAAKWPAKTIHFASGVTDTVKIFT